MATNTSNKIQKKILVDLVQEDTGYSTNEVENSMLAFDEPPSVPVSKGRRSEWVSEWVPSHEIQAPCGYDYIIQSG